MRHTTAGRRDSVVGVRELRQNLSVYLDRVKTGEPLTVSEHGRPVAMLVPLGEAVSTLERLIASGRATRPARDLAGLGPPKGRRQRVTDVLLAMRDEERW